MSDTPAKPLSKDEIAALMLKNLKANTDNPDALDEARAQRESSIKPLDLDGDIVPLPSLNDDGSLKNETSLQANPTQQR